MASSSKGKAKDLGARFHDYLNALQKEFELQCNATSTNNARSSRFSIYLGRLKGEFELLALKNESLEKEKVGYEAIIESQAKELQDIRHNIVCERYAGAQPIAARSQAVTREAPKVDVRAPLPKVNFLAPLPRVDLLARLPKVSTSILDDIAFNDEVEKEIEVEMVHTLRHINQVFCVKFTQDGKYVAAGCGDGNAYIYDVQRGYFTCRLGKSKESIRSLCFSHDGQCLAAGSSDKCIYIWKINAKKLSKTFQGTDAINSVAFSPNGRLLVSTSNNTVQLWNNRVAKTLTEPAKYRSSSAFFAGRYTSAIFSPDGRYIVASQEWGPLRVWDVRTGEFVRRVDTQFSTDNVAFMPDWKGLIGGGSSLKYWDISPFSSSEPTRLTAEREFSGHEGSVKSITISPDGRWVASGSGDKSVRIWHIRNATEQCTLSHDDSVLSVDFSPAGGYLASGAQDGAVTIWRYSDIIPGHLGGSD